MLGGFGTTTGTYTLNGPVIGANKIGTLAADVGSGSISFNNGANDLSIGAGNGTSGIAAASLTLATTGTVTQTQAILVTSLSLQGAGATYTLNDTFNTVGTLAANTGSVSLTDSTALAIGSAGGISGVTLGGTLALNLAGNLTQSATAPVIATTLTVARTDATNIDVTLINPNNAIANLGAVTTGQGTFTLTNSGDLALTAAASAGGGFTASTTGSLIGLASTATVSVGPKVKDVVLAAGGNFINNRGSTARSRAAAAG